MVQDLRDLVSYNSQIYHELIKLSLKVICQQQQAHYMNPAFFTNLSNHNWEYIINQFAHTRNTTISLPAMTSKKIAIPIHIHGNHWVALCQRIIYNQVVFLYSDDLNDPLQMEQQIKRILFSSKVSREFCPRASSWVSCRSQRYVPHSNECAPRTTLAPAVMLDHPDPPYITWLHESELGSAVPNLDGKPITVRSGYRLHFYYPNHNHTYHSATTDKKDVATLLSFSVLCRTGLPGPSPTRRYGHNSH